MTRNGVRSAAMILAMLLFSQAPAAAVEADWAIALKPGHVAIMRHAEAPGNFDPTGFRIDDCSTQRNLSEGGRTQARAIGDKFKQAGVTFARVLSSAWCRCKDTARLLTGIEPTVFPALNSFIKTPAQGPSQAARVREEIAAVAGLGPTLMVTHQVVITELTGVSPASGEVVVVTAKSAGAAGKLDVVARLKLK